MESLTHEQKSNVAIICQDSFYKNLNEKDAELANQGKYNFDHPNAFDHDLIYETLEKVRNNETVQIPIYDYKTNARVENEFTTVPPVDLVLMEGILVFYDQRCRDMFDMKIFVDADPDIRLARRVAVLAERENNPDSDNTAAPTPEPDLKRDMQDRGRNLDMILKHYETFVKPAFDDFCLPSKKYADIIIPRGAANDVAISLMTKHIQDFLSSTRNNQTPPKGNLAEINVAAHGQNGGLQLDGPDTSTEMEPGAPGGRRRRTQSHTQVVQQTPH